MAYAFQGAGESSKTAHGRGYSEEVCYTLNTIDVHGVAERGGMGWIVWRLTPRECERLQGFPDDWTLIEGASDSARYKALGNSMAVPVMRWIGERIERYEQESAAIPAVCEDAGKPAIAD